MSSEERFIVFPASGVNNGLVNVLDTLANGMIAGRFPPGFFKGGVHIDTRTGIRDMFRTERQTTNDNKKEDYAKIKKPRLLIGYNFHNFDTKDTGLGPASFGQYPNTHVLRKNLNGYWKFMRDDARGIEMLTSDLRVKVDFDITLDMATRDDQLSAVTYLYNIIKFNRGVWYEHLKTVFTLPNSMMHGLYKCLYGPHPPKGTDELFGKYLVENSGGGVVQEFMNGHRDKSFFRMKRNYDKLYVQMNGEPEMADPETKDMVYDKFSVTFSGFLELNLPIAYILHTPDMINNSIVNNSLFVSQETTDVGNYHMQFFTRVNKSLSRRNKPSIHVKMRNVLNEAFYVDSPLVESDFFDTFSEEIQNLIRKMNRKDVDEVFSVYFYEDDYLLDDGHFVERIELTPNDKFNYRLKYCDIAKEYQILVYCDPEALAHKRRMLGI